MKVIDCARVASVSADTVRHYAALGLIKATARTDSGYQVFSPNTIDRIRFIRTAAGLGFRLNDVAELLHMRKRGQLPCPEARAILARRLSEKQHQLEGELNLFNHMKQALDAWQQMQDGVPAGHQVCGLIEGLPPHRAAKVAAGTNAHVAEVTS